MHDIFGVQTSSLTIRSWFFDTLDMRCFMFDERPICTKTEQRCSGWIPWSCEDVCVEYDRFGYQAVGGKVQQGEIILQN